MISKTWRCILLLSLILLLPAVSQAAPRTVRAEIGTVDRLVEPAQWLSRFWETVTGLWRAATAADQTGGGATTNGDSGNTIDPDGKHG